MAPRAIWTATVNWTSCSSGIRRTRKTLRRAASQTIASSTGSSLTERKLWRIDVGVNIRAGAHDTQMSVYDFDGDGKAELAIKTAPGTKDGKGNYLKTGPAAGADNSQDLPRCSRHDPGRAGMDDRVRRHDRGGTGNRRNIRCSTGALPLRFGATRTGTGRSASTVGLPS